MYSIFTEQYVCNQLKQKKNNMSGFNKFHFSLVLNFIDFYFIVFSSNFKLITRKRESEKSKKKLPNQKLVFFFVVVFSFFTKLIFKKKERRKEKRKIQKKVKKLF